MAGFQRTRPCPGRGRAQPLLERAKFLAIFSTNLDEFFQIRVAGLIEQIHAGWTAPSPDGLTTAEQIDAIRTRVRDLVGRESRSSSTSSCPGSSRRVSPWCSGTTSRQPITCTSRRLPDRLFPVLTPLSVDPAHPFPYISDLSLNLAVVVRDKVTQVRRFARLKVPPLLPRFVNLPDGRRVIPLEQVIAANVSELFPGMEIVAHHVFRVSRDADLDIEIDEAEDSWPPIETSVRLRQRSPVVVRLEVNPTMPEDVLDLLIHELELDAADVYVIDGLLDLSGLWPIYALDRPDLKDDHGRRDAAGVRAVERGRDARTCSQRFATATSWSTSRTTRSRRRSRRSSSRPRATRRCWRSSRPSTGPPTGESPIVRSLIRAAEGGKQVVALVELQARGDEEANIGWARLMEQAGVHVLYGVVGLKTHAKISLVVREEARRSAATATWAPATTTRPPPRSTRTWACCRRTPI